MCGVERSVGSGSRSAASNCSRRPRATAASRPSSPRAPATARCTSTCEEDGLANADHDPTGRSAVRSDPGALAGADTRSRSIGSCSRISPARDHADRGRPRPRWRDVEPALLRRAGQPKELLARSRGRSHGRARTHAQRSTSGASSASSTVTSCAPVRRLACVNTAHAITFLFADVEGSTGLQEDPRLDYPAVIGTVRRLLREATSGHEGEEADSVGDEFVAVFADPVRAAEAAIAAQRAFRDEEWPTTVTVRVRIGLHTGTPCARRGGLHRDRRRSRVSYRQRRPRGADRLFRRGGHGARRPFAARARRVPVAGAFGARADLPAPGRRSST